MRNPTPRTPIARKPRAPVKKVNAKRKRESFKRCYGSKARVEFVKSLPCAACGVVGYSENAHVAPTAESGGTGRKADARWIAPLCGPHPALSFHGDLPGCHGSLHKDGRAYFQAIWHIDLEKCAAETEELWASSILEDTKT